MEIEVGPHRLCDALVFLVRQLIAFLALLVLILADVGVEHFGLVEYETSAGGEQDAQYGQGNRFLAQALQGGTDAHGQRIFGPPQVERIREEAEQEGYQTPVHVKRHLTGHERAKAVHIGVHQKRPAAVAQHIGAYFEGRPEERIHDDEGNKHEIRQVAVVDQVLDEDGDDSQKRELEQVEHEQAHRVLPELEAGVPIEGLEGHAHQDGGTEYRKERC